MNDPVIRRIQGGAYGFRQFRMLGQN
jgi:hypothetical protein